MIDKYEQHEPEDSNRFWWVVPVLTILGVAGIIIAVVLR